MKKGIKLWAAAGAAAAIFGWYFSPGMLRLRAMPQIVEEPDSQGALLCSIKQNGGAAYVRKSKDASLGTQYTVSLFGIIPLRTIEQATTGTLVTLGGEALGIVLHTKGVQVVGFAGVETKDGRLAPASSAGLKEGDTILAVNGKEIQDAADFQTHMGETSCLLTCLREGEAFQVQVQPALEQNTGCWRLGAYVRDSTSGIGTLSFIKGGKFCALGHPIADIDTGTMLERGHGYVTKAKVLRTVKGTPGQVGELVGTFSLHEGDAVGSIEKNTVFGIEGTLLAGISGSTNLPIAQPGEVHTGEATLYVTLEGEHPLPYRCRILRADVQSAPEVQGVIIEITDEELLEKTGGIVPGMSGSPLVQNGKLIGVVTHVFVNEPRRGYCVYAKWMEQTLLS